MLCRTSRSINTCVCCAVRCANGLVIGRMAESFFQSLVNATRAPCLCVPADWLIYQLIYRLKTVLTKTELVLFRGVGIIRISSGGLAAPEIFIWVA